MGIVKLQLHLPAK
jgi:hypothetical protein